MFKKFITATAFAGALLLVPCVASAGVSSDPEATYTEIAQQDSQTEVRGEWTDSKEVNTVQESSTARKMTQAEKARNAAENDKYGGAITIIAMCIVLFVLIILSVLFLFFGKITTALHAYKKRQAHGVDYKQAEPHHTESDSGEVIAAISMALAEHLGQGHDIEDTILTIRRMRKAYSPWNSKIYNLRVVPMLDNRNDAHRRSLK